jgi:hypothetical protein
LQNTTAVEIIVVNASSTDKTAAVAEAAETRARKTVLTSVTGRGQAHNAGAAAATGDIIFFVHGDTKPPLGWDKLIRDTLKDPTVVMGAFSFGVDRASFSKTNFWGGAPTGMGTVEWFANLRAHRFQLPYGDQGLFMLRGRWELVGPMPELLVMEDFEFLKRVRTTAIAEGKRIAVLDQVALCSGRRWEKHGVPYSTFANQWFVFAYSSLGYSDKDIYRLYYGKEPTGTTRPASVKAPVSTLASASPRSPRSPLGPARIPQDLTNGTLLSVSHGASKAAAAAAAESPSSRAVAPAGLPASLASQARSSRPGPQRSHAAHTVGRAAGKHGDSWPEVGAEDLLTGMPDMK